MGCKQGLERTSMMKHLRSASTTMKITLLKGEESWEMSMSEPHAAKPGRKALWGKKPDAKMRIAQMVKTLARKHEGFWM